MDALLRITLLGLLAGGSLALVSWWQRRPLPESGRFAPGVTVFTGPDCRLCGPLVHALGRVGVEPQIVDIADAAPPPGIRSLPTVLVADAAGEVVLRRSGRAALEDVVTIAGLSQALGGHAAHRPDH
jgi:hypothetical protein